MCAKERSDDMPKYLTRRSDGRSQNYYVRLIPPTEIHHLLPRSELDKRLSTGTPDKQKAKAVAAKI